jgi:hypothetical protein
MPQRHPSSVKDAVALVNIMDPNLHDVAVSFLMSALAPRSDVPVLAKLELGVRSHDPF